MFDQHLLPTSDCQITVGTLIKLSRPKSLIIQDLVTIVAFSYVFERGAVAAGPTSIYLACFRVYLRICLVGATWGL